MPLLGHGGKKLRIGAKVTFGDGEMAAEVVGEGADGNRLVRFDYEGIFLETLERLGRISPVILSSASRREASLRSRGVWAMSSGGRSK